MNSEIMGIKTIDWQKKPNEDDELIGLINKLFASRRGHIVKMPDPGTPVLACMSGGQDSTATIAILLEEFGLNVYPFFINRNQSNYLYEKKSVVHYDSYFSSKYPNLYNKCFEIKMDTPSLSYKNLLTPDLQKNHIGYPARNTMIFITGAEYAYGLQKEGLSIKTVFGATVGSDGLYHSSLTWTRVTNLAICQFFNDYDWQLLSLAIENELGNQYDKDIMIKYCENHNISLQFTRTCVKASEIQCGNCICCYDRRRCFKLAGVEDRTEYLNPYPDSEPEH